jgi:hypothetical protein
MSWNDKYTAPDNGIKWTNLGPLKPKRKFFRASGWQWLSLICISFGTALTVTGLAITGGLIHKYGLSMFFRILYFLIFHHK